MTSIQSHSIVAVCFGVCVAVGGSWVVVALVKARVVGGVVRVLIVVRQGGRRTVRVMMLPALPRVVHVAVHVMIHERRRRQFLFTVTLTRLKQESLFSTTKLVTTSADASHSQLEPKHSSASAW